MTNKEKFKEVFGFDLPEVLEDGCFYDGEGCPDIDRRCCDCEYDGIYYWPKEYKLPEAERERILKRTNLDAFRDAHEKIGPFEWSDVIAYGLCCTLKCSECPCKETCESIPILVCDRWKILAAWLREEAPHE